MIARIIPTLLLFCFVLERGTADYVAAVAEHNVYYGTDSESSESKLAKNLEIYDGLIQLSADKGAHVIVFPEFGLTPISNDPMVRTDLYTYMEKIPDVSASETIIPCENPDFDSRPILSRMSCSSQHANQLVLINMIDNVACDVAADTNCPEDGQYIYNTDVLFDSGVMVAKYHKTHEWPGLTQEGYDHPAAPSYVTYTSKFGVEFGLFICFDIVFPDPAKVLRDSGVEHFLYAVMQGVLGERTIIDGWSRNNNATVLSSNLGAGKPQTDIQLGDCSGIIVNGEELPSSKHYLSGALGYAFPDENILIATVPTVAPSN